MESTAAAASRPSSWRAAVLVGSISAVLGFIMLGHKSLWFDETFDVMRTRGSWTSVVNLIKGTEMSQAAYLLGFKVWSGTVDGATLLRSPSVVAAAVASALLVTLGSRLFDRTTGIVAGILLATNEFLVRWSQQARTYALVTLAVVVATLLFLKALEDPRRRNWILYAVAAAFAVYCHFFAGFVIAAHVLSTPFTVPRPPVRRVLEAAGVFLVLIVPALYFTVHAGRSQIDWIPVPSVHVVTHALDNASGHNPLAWVTTVGGLTVLAYQVGMGRRNAPWQLVLVGGWIALPVLLALLVSQAVHPILGPSYLIVITPAIALASAVLITTLARARRVAGVVALVVLVGVSLLQIKRWYQRPSEDWRAAAAYVARAHGTAAVAVAPPYAIDAFRYYAPSAPLARTPLTGRTLLIVRTSDDSEVPGVVAEAVGPASQLRRVDEKRFGLNVRAILLDTRP